jgi:ABC-type Fe3+-hydroxamate transport system substrate-binding protein
MQNTITDARGKKVFTDDAPRRIVSLVPSWKVILLDGKVLTWYGVRMGESLKILRELIRGN